MKMYGKHGKGVVKESGHPGEVTSFAGIWSSDIAKWSIIWVKCMAELKLFCRNINPAAMCRKVYKS